jgi:hypothetical protein
MNLQIFFYYHLQDYVARLMTSGMVKTVKILQWIIRSQASKVTSLREVV